MKVLTYLLLMLVPLASADAYESNVSIFTNIIKDIKSSKIAIEYDKNLYTAIYHNDDEKFDDVNIPFRVISPLSMAQKYDLTLFGSHHECNGNSIKVTTKIDNIVMDKGDVNNHLDFVNSNTSDKWTDHKLTLMYPKIKQKSVEQQCLGNIIISVELAI